MEGAKVPLGGGVVLIAGAAGNAGAGGVTGAGERGAGVPPPDGNRTAGGGTCPHIHWLVITSKKGTCA